MKLRCRRAENRGSSPAAPDVGRTLTRGGGAGQRDPAARRENATSVRGRPGGRGTRRVPVARPPVRRTESRPRDRFRDDGPRVRPFPEGFENDGPRVRPFPEGFENDGPRVRPFPGDSRTTVQGSDPSRRVSAFARRTPVGALREGEASVRSRRSSSAARSGSGGCHSKGAHLRPHPVRGAVVRGGAQVSSGAVAGGCT